MIPKKIHYCWFGGTQKPKLAKKCIKSWKKYCKDYELIEWNEDNFDITNAPLYVRQAYAAKKWAFVTDYVRLKVVYECGGIYFDTDVLVKKSFEKLLKYCAFFGFENNRYVATGLGFGSEKKMIILKKLLEQYTTIPFVLENSEYDFTPCPQRNTEVFIKYGLVQNGKTQILNDNIVILSPEYLCPIDYKTQKRHITKNTLSIHCFSASWMSEEGKRLHENHAKIIKKINRRHVIKHFPNKIAMRIFGQEKYYKIKQRIKK